MAPDRTREVITYGSYLRVPELLALQSPLSTPPLTDELLFIIGQQAQELWIKQVLIDLRGAIDCLLDDRLAEALRPLGRINRVLRVLGQELEVMELVTPAEFHRFRGELRAASGLESEQFRELEIASGLRDDAYLRVVDRLIDLPAVLERWPVSLRAALDGMLRNIDPDPLQAAIALYAEPASDPLRYEVAEACSDYEMRLQAWRFHHVQVVERVIGDRSAGTGGSAGSAYLMRTLTYRFFPELWQARNALSGRPT